MTRNGLIEALEKTHLSQRAAARELGIDERTMRRYVAGDAKVPRAVALAVQRLWSVRYVGWCVLSIYSKGLAECSTDEAFEMKGHLSACGTTDLFENLGASELDVIGKLAGQMLAWADSNWSSNLRRATVLKELGTQILNHCTRVKELEKRATRKAKQRRSNG
jgi:hypothetical protein